MGVVRFYRLKMLFRATIREVAVLVSFATIHSSVETDQGGSGVRKHFATRVVSEEGVMMYSLSRLRHQAPRVLDRRLRGFGQGVIYIWSTGELELLLVSGTKNKILFRYLLGRCTPPPS